MRFPSLALLADRAVAVLRRFPLTLAAGIVAAGFGITAVGSKADEEYWIRLVFVTVLAFPLTIAITLLAETRKWKGGWRAIALGAGVAALLGFAAIWPGPEAKPDAIRYFQLSAALHLAVAFLPLVGAAESIAFWQYNRRLFLGFLRAFIFSAVLFAGIAVALAALDHLFGLTIDEKAYVRIWLVAALVVNTWIFLAAVPEDLAALDRDTEYPRGLKVFAQYILTPLAFTYLVILLAYLIKIIGGGEWPSGWVGWLVASVSVTGLLGFLLVHPLRDDPDEGWIRTYTRWLFIGLVPAAVMLLVAFWKRIVPYGLTEPRMLGLVLGFWLLGIALLFAVKNNTSIRLIPTTLAALLLVTLYGPISLTQVSIRSQGQRFASMLGRDTGDSAAANAREASAALRFLMERRAGDEIAARIGRPLPSIEWDTIPGHPVAQDSLGMRIMALAGATYVPAYVYGREGSFHVASSARSSLPVTGFDWLIAMSASDTAARLVGPDSMSVAILPNANSRFVRVRTGNDTLAFDLDSLTRRYADAVPSRESIPAEQLRLEASTGRRRGILALERISGVRYTDSLRIDHWNGWLLLRNEAVTQQTSER